MDFKIPEKLLNIETRNFSLGISDIDLFEESELEKKQKGYRVNGVTGEPIKEWIGDNFIVIGIDTCCGDPIIAQIDNPELPIYTMFHDDWETIQLIADSLDKFVQILDKLEETDLFNKECVDNVIEEVKEIAPEATGDYWSALIISAYEFFTEESYE